jgi:hypothetical protein
MKKMITATLAAMMCLGMAHAKQPNVVIIYGDDVGFGDVGAYGSEMIPTPNIDKLAETGLRFTDAHSSSPNCSPSRYALLTGEHPVRVGIKILGATRPLAIDPDTFTLPALFKKAGYNTLNFMAFFEVLSNFQEKLINNIYMITYPILICSIYDINYIIGLSIY